jgi:deoxycytidylate deaminase
MIHGMEVLDKSYSKVAKTLSEISTDETCKSGAVVVNDDGLVVSTGVSSETSTAECEAISNACRLASKLINATIYVTRLPCYDSSLEIVKSGISRVVYEIDEHSTVDFYQLYRAYGISLEKVEL